MIDMEVMDINSFWEARPAETPTVQRGNYLKPPALADPGTADITRPPYQIPASFCLEPGDV